MSSSLYTFRSYQPADFDRYVRFNIEAEKLEPTGRPVSPQVLAEYLHRPGYSPEQNLFIVETDENIVGYMDVAPEVKIGRVILNCFIHPDHRSRGLASKLLGYGTHRAQELGAKVAHVNIPCDNVVAKSVLSRLGFKFVRRFLGLSLDISEVRGQDIDRPARQCRHLQRGEEDRLTQLQNRSFAGTWGYNPNTVQEITYWVNSISCSPEDIVLTDDGGKMVAYCWTRLIYEAKAAPGYRKGQIFMLGVDPDYRGQGLGKAILLAGLSHLESKGVQIAHVTVDSGNKAACALYRSVGFKVRTSSLWYEKSIT